MIELIDTSASEIAAEFIRARRRAGSPAMGMVMTLVIVADDGDADKAMEAARSASREHPARILGVVVGGRRGQSRVDAEVGIGSGASGERALIRLTGEVTRHAGSVVLPLLLPDSPVVVWWPGRAPEDTAGDPLGALGTRRITDAAVGALRQGPGDADAVHHLLRRQHRPGLDPDHRVAGAAGGRARPAPGHGHRRVGDGRADQPQRGPALGLARRPAALRRTTRQLARARASPRWC